MERLSQVMLQVLDVVAHEVLERRGLVGTWCVKRNLVEIVARARPLTRGRIGGRHQARDVMVVSLPEADEVPPGPLAIPLDPNLAGLVFFVQALFLEPAGLRLTNVERDVVVRLQ